MVSAISQKISKKRRRLVHIPVAELPKLIEEDIPLKEWKTKPAKIIQLDQELDLINEKISSLRRKNSQEIIYLTNKK